MPKIRVLKDIRNGIKYRRTQYLFACPGCECEHAFSLISEGGNHNFNMDLDSPSVLPELLFTIGRNCHSIIAEGKIKYFNDCNHGFAGETITLPEII